jgi:hypothetical protein
MKKEPSIKTKKRAQPRNLSEAGITCRPFTSVAIQASDGVIRNFSSDGFYIETSGNFKPGTILLVRTTLRSPASSLSVTGERARSISLAEIKWVQELADESTARYGMGLKYLEY